MQHTQRTTHTLSRHVLAGALFFVFSLGVAAPLAHAADVSDAVLGGTTETNKLITKLRGTADIKSPGEVVFKVVEVILGLLGIVAVIMMMYAGFLWLTAGGEEDKATKGRTILFQAVIGLIIILASYTVTYFVLRQLSIAVTGQS